MAHEARMEAWFADPQASRPKEKAAEDGGGALRCRVLDHRLGRSIARDRAQGRYALDIAFYGRRCS